MQLPSWLTYDNVMGALITLIAGIILRVLKTPKDNERAALLTTLANSAAANAVNLMPDRPWAELLQATVQRLAAESTVPTHNTQKLETAALAALVRLGKTQNGAS